MNAYKRPGYRRAVSDLQNFLRVSSKPDQPGASLVPDGIYGECTAKAVREFQRCHNIADTGKVDYRTWQVLVDEYGKVSSEKDMPIPISPFSAHLLDNCLKVGDVSDTVGIVRLMVCCLGLEYGCFENIAAGNAFDEELEKAISEFQSIHGLEPNGIIDKNTWNHLANEYNRYVKRNE